MTRKVQSSKFKVQNYGISIYFFIITASLIFASVAFASEGGGEGAQNFTWKDWQWPVINFALLVFILVFFGRKPIGEFFKKRTELIEKSLKEASEAKEFARKTLNEVKERFKNTDSEIEQIIEAARKSGEKEKEAIIAEGERLKEKIIEQAKAGIDFELQKAKEKIKSEAALMALELAEKQIEERLGGKEQEALIDDYIKRLEAKN
ncbi:MAG TPA: ATP synthase F0 subunit B [Nitrospirae bacterium]|nr:ATP synthase subunit b, sodium ion specific [bacterium BMS3Abin06]HDH12979.1 ATP synthase F0 subunit B [Nitrospirota bacterium]HDZ02960.1 ATP synthase F0 subunit B [Nitrospirota bacterium]